MSKKIIIYDTSLRDGTQAEEINYTVNDKIRITKRLLEFGIDFIEGGWPGSNPRDVEFFKAVHEQKIDLNRISAFSSTRRARLTCDDDPIIQQLLAVDIPNLTVFGKSWDLHVTEALNITLEQNLELIFDTIKYLKSRVDKVFFDAEHFFDGYKHNKQYAKDVVKIAIEAGADCIVLCETNGGTLPDEIISICSGIKPTIGSTPFGIHAHNDCECAVANSVVAVNAGATHVQGTINGIGERCGNANLCTIIPNLQLKYKYNCIPEDKLVSLKNLSGFIYELGNQNPDHKQPYVGKSAFAHKGGVHVSAIMKNPATYEHIKPELVGNMQRVLLSDLSGKSNLLYKVKKFGIGIDDNDPKLNVLLATLKDMENKGYEYEGAEASFELLILSSLGKIPNFFDIYNYRVIDERPNDSQPFSEATVKVFVDGIMEHTASNGNGPVNALDNAVRKALCKFYPNLEDMSLVDYKVRILDGKKGTEALTRVLIESTDSNSSWMTVGVASNIVDASYQALVDSLQYKLYKDSVKKGSVNNNDTKS